jgi:two-component system sensor histidine kinase UhpB
MGLSVAVRQLAEAAAARGGLSLDLNVGESLGHLVPEVEQCYYRVAQEAVENVVNHARANSLRVSLLRADDLLVLEVADDGCGFSVQELNLGSSPPEPLNDGLGYGAFKFGIKGMQERADLIGARLEVESALGRGTVIRLQGGTRASGGGNP